MSAIPRWPAWIAVVLLGGAAGCVKVPNYGPQIIRPAPRPQVIIYEESTMRDPRASLNEDRARMRSVMGAGER